MFPLFPDLVREALDTASYLFVPVVGLAFFSGFAGVLYGSVRVLLAWS